MTGCLMTTLAAGGLGLSCLGVLAVHACQLHTGCSCVQALCSSFPAVVLCSRRFWLACHPQLRVCALRCCHAVSPVHRLYVCVFAACPNQQQRLRIVFAVAVCYEGVCAAGRGLRVCRAPVRCSYCSCCTCACKVCAPMLILAMPCLS